VVNGDERVSSTLCAVLEGGGYRCHVASDVDQARDRLELEPYAVLVCGLDMSQDSTLALVRDAATAHPQTASVVVSGMDARGSDASASGLAPSDHFLKPLDPNQARCERLEDLVSQRTRELHEALKRVSAAAGHIRVSREALIGRLCRIIAYRDEETGGHIERMAHYCQLLASRLGLHAESMRIASAMHDVGKIAVPDRILLKAGPLSPGERAEMERHTEIGHAILTGSGSKLLELAATIAYTHHERYDGTGYPRQLAGEAIPVEGRVAAVADVFDALTSQRPYRAALPMDEALETMIAERGRHFDPHVLDAFLDSVDEAVAIHEPHRVAAR
jgi:putative two-component system response regulator